MKKINVLIRAVFLSASFYLISPLSAAPLDEAKASFSQGRFEDVEMVLQSVLEQDPAPIEAVELSYRAARASGKVYTAERRVRELIDRRGGQESGWIFEGAKVSLDLGQDARAMDRLMFFVRQQKTKSPELAEALDLLSRHSLFPEAFAAYVRLYPDRVDFTSGFRMMERIRRNSQPKAFLQMGKLLLTHFQEDWQIDRVQNEIWDAVDGQMLGLSRDDAYDALFTGKITGFDVIEEMISRRGIDHPELIKLQTAAGRPLPEYILKRFDGFDRIDSKVVRESVVQSYLKLEPMYRASGDADLYRAYLWRIFSEPEAFIPDSGRLIPETQAEAFFRAATQLHPKNEWNQLRWMGRYVVGDHRETKRRFVQNDERRLALLQELHPAFRGDELQYLVDSSPNKGRAIQALIQLTQGRQDVRIDLLDEMDEQNSGDLVAATAGYELLMKPTNFDERLLARHFVDSDALTEDQKLRVLEKVYQETANSRRLKSLLEHRDSDLEDHPKLRSFRDRLDLNAAPRDPILSILMKVESDKNLRDREKNKPKKEFTAKIRQAFDSYGKPYPVENASDARSTYMARLLELYRNTCDDRTEGRRKYAEVVGPRLSPHADWEAFFEFTIDDSGGDGLATYHAAAAALQAGLPYRTQFRHVWHPDSGKEPILEPFYQQMSTEAVKGYLARNRDQWSPEVLADQMVNAMKHHSLVRGSGWQVREMLERLRQQKEEKKSLEIPLDVLANGIFKVTGEGAMGADWQIQRELLRLYRHSGRARDGVIRLTQVSEKMANPADRLEVLLSAMTSDRDNVPGGSLEGPLEPGTKLYLFLEIILPAFRELEESDWANMFISNELFRSLGWYLGRRELEESRKKNLYELRSYLVMALAAGAPGDVGWNEFGWGVDDAIKDALAKNKTSMLVSLVNLTGREAENTDRRRIEPVVKTLQEAGKMELLLLLTQQVKTDDPAAKTLLNQARAVAGADVQGIYPVDPNDPEYPLYVAADELARNNAEQAWNLLRENLKVFAEDPLLYPQEFSGWSLEKLREVKGENGELEELSFALSEQILARDDEVTPWLKARVMLNRAEVFRARKDFEAARLEYKTLRTNPDLQATPFGRQAMFRDVDLMIAMGNTSAAEGLIEYWLSNPDPELQVKAYYFRALMAFDAGDNDATREHLEKVFELDFTNSESRLLHGKWRLRTNYEVDNPEVLLGTLRDRTILRPGQPLRVSVQDPNLSVVGGGSAIPVVIRTSDGGDEERLSLFPSTRDPKLFRGAMDTDLAMAKPGNQILEVNGQDVVSYEIDPTFLSQRGMTTTDPKRLRIVDDARLAVSAGRILSEAEQQAMEVQSQMSADEPGRSDRMSQVRPGNPFYVMVRDRDESTGKEGNSVPVRVSTSSGDEIRGVTLKETAPYSGQFRGEISTALPPPRASASDSAEGVDIGAVINNSRTGFWRSRSDGAAGKWIKADTMGSYEVKRVRIQTPDASRIAQVNLYGSLMGEEKRLGSFPERSVVGGGVQVQTTGARLRSLVDYRRYFSEAKDAPATQRSFSYDSNKIRGRRFQLQGAFWMPENRQLRLRVIPMEEGHKYPLNDLWVDFLVNGEKIAGGRGRDLMKSPIYLTLPRGGHILEAFGYARDDSDAFALAIEQPDGSVIPLPEEWFQTQGNPELQAFLKDRARLTRGEDSWTATFSTPERLRSLRWEFVQYAGDAITVTEFQIEDATGKTILPSATDYTDALGNDVLEIAPGDRITVNYDDRTTTEGQRRQLSQQLSSSFNNGTLAFYYEALNQTERGMVRSLYDAYRFLPGDDFLVVVEDADLDTGPGVDSVDVTIKTRSGESVTITATEIQDPDHRQGAPVHNSLFQALLRTSQEAPTSGTTLNVKEGDRITAGYLDQENTSPGIPVTRSTQLESVQKMDPQVSIYHTWREAVEDTSDEAQIRLEQIKKRTGNEHVKPILNWSTYGMPMLEDALSNDILTANVDTSLPIEVYYPSEAMHRGSVLTLKILTASERESARLEGRSPQVITFPMGLGTATSGIRVQSNPQLSSDELGMSQPEPNATFGTRLRFRLGTERALDEDPDRQVIPVQGNDQVYVTLFTDEQELIFEQVFQLQSEGEIALMDSTYEAGREKIHLGERFFVQVLDSDQDVSGEMDEVTVAVNTTRHGKQAELVLRETMPHSGVFSGVMMPRFLQPAPPAEAVEGAAEEASEQEMSPDLVGIPTIEVAFGEQIQFVYQDEVTIPVRKPGPRTATGNIFEGSDGSMMAFTKFFPNADMAVRVQFRLAESLFEMAKDYRKLKQPERSANAIAEGKRILEEALVNYPDTGLAVEGEYLLANLYQEMAAERVESDPEQSRTYYQEALSRFSAILSGYPDSEFAARAQFHKALCLEKLGDFAKASEEYVKMTYIFPESPLVGEAAIRLATHYYKNEQRFDTAGKIYSNFYERFPSHPLASKALFMGAQSHMKQGEVWETERREKGVSERELKTERILDEYRSAVESLENLINSEDDSVNKEMRAQAMYWAGDASLRAMEYADAFLFLKRTTFEYPDSEWARRARGLLLQSAESFEGLE